MQYSKALCFMSSFILVLIIAGCSTKEVVKGNEVKSKVEKLEKSFRQEKVKPINSFSLPTDVKIDTIIVNNEEKQITIKLNKELSYLPFRKENVSEIYDFFRKYFGTDYAQYKFSVRTMGYDIRDLIPNYFRDYRSDYDYSRLPRTTPLRPNPVVQDISKKYKPTKGLFNRNIVVWPSHGWYYDNEENRWKWQRPRLFESVEDLLPYSFVIPYLEPMLENAGANVFIPRERDTQKNEVIVDNDSNNEISYVEKIYDNKTYWKKGIGKGFAVGNTPYASGVNPFDLGTYKYVSADSTKKAQVSWIPYIPQTGYYCVYVSYESLQNSINDAHYTVYHAGDTTHFLVNQTIGDKTWEYLGRFKFFKGFNPNEDKVVLTNQSSEPLDKLAFPAGRVVTADGVRFGGGMGVIERNGLTSGRPKYEEGARYWLQYSGMPDTLVYNLNDNKNDYVDDYESRAEYADYLYGAPFGPNRDRNVKGLGIPIDLSLAFHTDAGISHNDSTIGTLAIYSLDDIDTSKVFPNGMSRMVNRDLADLIQTQIVDDIRAKYDTTWVRRSLLNGKYSEAARPNFPSALLELLAHQNFLDMKFGLDPRFKFDVARAIYKAMLRFLSVQDDFQYQVQPLPVTHFTSYFKKDGDLILKWKPQLDPLEPTAKPDRYIVYTKINDGDFNNGTETDSCKLVIKNLQEGKIYSYKVTAVNDGGESFPSEVLSVCSLDNGKPTVLIINGFTRICGPLSVSTNKFSGFLNFDDPGVPYKYDISYTGPQFNFNPLSKYISNDSPGFGASGSNYETKIIAGNTFNFPYIHGVSLEDAGYSFVSSSVSAVMDSMINLNNYKYVDLILGEQKTTHWQRSYMDSVRGVQFKAFPGKLQGLIGKYLSGGGNLFLSGSYVGSDLLSSPNDYDTTFASRTLKYRYDAAHASGDGDVISADSSFYPLHDEFEFNVQPNDSIYAVNAPDAISNTGQSQVLLRYAENQFPAAVGYKGNYGVVAFGFPFETVLNQTSRDSLMESVMNFLKSRKVKDSKN